MPKSHKPQIQITEEQHQRLQIIKEMLEDRASEDLGLSRQSWQPSFADALEYLFDEYGYRDSLEQRRQSVFEEGDSMDSDADCDFAPSSENNGR